MSPVPTMIFTGGPIEDKPGDLEAQHMAASSRRMREGSGRKLREESARTQTGRLSDSRLSLECSGRSRNRQGSGRLSLEIDQSHHKEAPPLDGPWRRAVHEWHAGRWFDIDDCGRMLDVPSTFGGTQTIYKWLIWLWMMATLIYLWHTAGTGWVLGNLDHWALLISVLYQTLSLANGHFAPPRSVAGVNLYLKVFWILFEIAAHLQLLVTLLFWTIVFPTNTDTLLPVGYGTFALHGLGLMAVWIDGMVLNRIPVRIQHYFILLAVDTIYCLWTIVHAAAGWGSGTTVTTSSSEESTPAQTDAIYLALDWQNEVVQSVFFMIAILAFFAPLCFVLQYCFSLYTFPWTWNGSKSRKVLELQMNMMRSARTDSPRESPKKRPNNNPRPLPQSNLSETSRSSSGQPEPEKPPPIESMSVRQLKKELEKYDISTDDFVEKGQLVEILELQMNMMRSARTDSPRESPKKRPSNNPKKPPPVESMSIRQLKNELERRNISTDSFVEKSQLVEAVRIVQGGRKASDARAKSTPKQQGRRATTPSKAVKTPTAAAPGRRASTSAPASTPKIKNEPKRASTGIALETPKKNKTTAPQKGRKASTTKKTQTYNSKTKQSKRARPKLNRDLSHMDIC